jgi:hypothetical protein
MTARAQVVPNRSISGSVRDSAGRAIAGAEVSVADLKRRMLTGANGSFRFDSIVPGRYAIRARKIGFNPQTVQISVVDSSVTRADFGLVPSVQALPPIVSVVNRKGLWGHVDELGQGPLPGARVEVLGSGRSAQTDANGDFYVALPHGGRYMVSISKDSFSTRFVGVRIPDDSGRSIASQLERAGPLAKSQAWDILDLRQRQAWVPTKDRVLYTREDLEELRIEWIYDAVDRLGPQFGAREHYNRDCSVVIDGGPKTANISTLTIDDIETVEVYRGWGAVLSPVSAAVQPKSKKSKFKKAPPPVFSMKWKDAAMENYTRVCPAIFVWLR